ncbi:MAG: hypothetical protein ACE14V_07285 [bacterium]
MKKRFIKLTMLVFIVLISIVGNEKVCSSQDTTLYKTPQIDDVDISGNCMSVPLGKIILVRKKDKYGAIKITKTWTRANSIVSLFHKENLDTYASYESYYQADGTGDFNKKNVAIVKGKTSNKMRISLILLHPCQTGNPFVQCGPLELFCDVDFDGSYRLCFERKFYDQDSTADIWNNQTDYDLEFAPTKWNNILEVKVFDPRLEWFRYDDYRKTTTVPVDKLWIDNEPNRIVNNPPYNIRPRSNDVYIDDYTIAVPVGRIILIKHGNWYGAVKYLNCWAEESNTVSSNNRQQKYYANYESYFQRDGSGDFKKQNVEIYKKNISFKIPDDPLHEDNLNIFCGPLRINSTGKSKILGLNFGYCFMQNTFSGELAPTIWTDIVDVDVFDKRIMWYRSEERPDIYIPIDKLWDEKK